MMCSVMQPTYLPWCGYFDLIDQSDAFVFYDDVQFVKQSWQTRNRIKTANGVSFLNVPVLKTSLNSNINTIEIDNLKPWCKKTLKTLFYTYQKCDSFEEVYSFMEALLNRNFEKLSTINHTIITEICQKIGIKSSFHVSSNLASTNTKKDTRLVHICKELHCNTYLSTLGSAFYIEEINPGGQFTLESIKLYYQNYKPVVYKQNFGEFVPYMSIVDLLFNEGFDNALRIIRNGRKPSLQSKDL